MKSLFLSIAVSFVLFVNFALGQDLVRLDIGKPVPNFTLKGLNGNSYTLDSELKKHKWVVLEWFNYDCPFVKNY